MLKENSLSLDPINSFHMCTFSAFRYKAVNGTTLKVKVMFLASFTLFFLTFFFITAPQIIKFYTLLNHNFTTRHLIIFTQS